MKVAACLSFMLVSLFGLSIGEKVVCYYTNWSYYRQGVGKYSPSDIDPNLCTHILYSFAVLENNKLKIFDKWLDIDLKFLEHVADVREKNPSVKVMLAVGGWNAGSIPFSNMAKSSSTRRVFIDSVVEFMNRFDYDGLDLDWEYPAKRGGKPEDKQNFSLLIRELQARFTQIARSSGKPKLLLSAAVGPAPATASVAYDMRTICRELDFVNLMNYDIHGSWESKTGYASPLYAGPKEVNPQNMPDTMTRNWINAGCARDKLIFGIPTYGRGWSLRAGSRPEVGAPGNPGRPGPYVGATGMMSYGEICNKLSNGWTETFDSVAIQAVATGDNQWYSYDNERSVAAKVNYIKSMRLGGAMIWALDFDDFNGKACGKGRYPLLSIISRGMKGRRRVITPTTRRNISYTRRTTSATPTTSTTTTRAPSTSRPSSRCQPSCSSNGLTYLADRCDPQVFYMCHNRRAYRMTCGNGTVFRSSCNCCVRQQ